MIKKLPFLLCLFIGSLSGRNSSSQIPIAEPPVPKLEASQNPLLTRLFKAPDCFVPQAIAVQKVRKDNQDPQIDRYIDVILRGVTPWPDIFGRWRNNRRDLNLQIWGALENPKNTEGPLFVDYKLSSICYPDKVFATGRLVVQELPRKGHKNHVFMSKLDHVNFMTPLANDFETWLEIRVQKMSPRAARLRSVKSLADAETLTLLDIALWRRQKTKNEFDPQNHQGGDLPEEFTLLDAFLVEQF